MSPSETDPPPEAGPPAPSPSASGPSASGPPEKSWGNIGPKHWSRARKDMNEDALDYMRERSRAPGVESGGSHRNSYCMSCNGVLPLEYDSRVPGERETPSECPHCGVAIEGRVQAMFNWVEIDQVHGGDAKAILPLLLLALAGLAALVWWLIR